MLMEERENGK